MIPLVKVLWHNQHREEATWDREDEVSLSILSLNFEDKIIFLGVGIVTSQLLISTKTSLSTRLMFDIFLRALMAEFYRQKVLAHAR